MNQVKNYSQIRHEFYDKYQRKIVPLVKRYEHERKCKLVLAILIGAILITIGIALILAAINDEHASNNNIKNALESGFYCFGFAWVAWYSIKKSFENKIKEKIMPTVVGCFNNLNWSKNDYFYDLGKYVNSYVIPQYTSKETDDVFRGMHNDVNFEILELELTRGSGKNTTTVFDGVVIKLDMNKNFTSHTVITPDSLFHHSPSKELRHTVLEDVAFEKKFDVFTDDEVDARYLITPSFMQRLKAMKVAFKANKMTCAFYNEYFFVALNTNKDLFSLCSLIKPIDDAQQYFQMYEEIISIIKLIDHFKLNQKIGL